MKAINLIPLEERRGAGAPGRSGGVVYGLLGGLGVLVLMVAAVVATSHSIKTKQAELASVTQQAQAAETQAGSLQAYTEFASLRTNREQTVSSLAASRFDWAHALHELARTVPNGVDLLSLRGTVSPSVTVPGTTDPLRASLNVPALELEGCAPSQDGVAVVMAAMRRMDGVQRVSLSSSERNPQGAAGSAPVGSTSSAGSSNTDCRASSFKRAQFSMTVFYAAPVAPALPAATTATTATGTATAPTTTPAAGTTGGTK
jgi:Tfp pilus assembly protein PilN